MKKTHGCLITRGDIYYLRYSVNGKVKQKSLGVTTLKEAERERDKILVPALAAKTREDVLYHVAKSRKLMVKSEVPMADAWNAYLKNTKRPDSSETTLDYYKRTFSKFTDWLAKHRPLKKTIGDITDDDAEEYCGHLWGTGVSGSTFNNNMGVCKLVTKILMGVSPFAGIKLKVEQKINRKNLTEQEVLRVLKVFDDPDFHVENKDEFRVMFHIGAWTGLRMVDAVSLAWDDVSFPGNVISLTPRKTKRIGRKVSIPLHPMLRDTLSRLPRNGTPHIMPKLLARYNKGFGLLTRCAARVFTAAGLETTFTPEGVGQRKHRSAQYGFHSFRSSFASFAANAGVPMITLAAILGDNVATLEKYYVHISTEAKERAIASLPTLADKRRLATGEPTDADRIAKAVRILKTMKIPVKAKKRLLQVLVR